MNPRCLGILADKPQVLRKSCPINQRCFCILDDKPQVLNPKNFPPLVWTYPDGAQGVGALRLPPRAPVTSESLGTALRSGGSCQENKRILVKIHPQGKEDPTSGQKKIPIQDKNILENQSGDRESLRLVTIEEGCGEDFVKWRPRF